MPPKTPKKTPSRASSRLNSREPTPTQAAKEDVAGVGKKSNAAYGVGGRAPKPQDVQAVGQSFEGAMGAAQALAARPPPSTLETVQEDQEEISANTTSQLEAAEPATLPHINHGTNQAPPHNSLQKWILWFLFGLVLAVSFFRIQAWTLSTLSQQLESLHSSLNTSQSQSNQAYAEIKKIKTRDALINFVERILLDEEIIRYSIRNWLDEDFKARVDPVLSSPSLYHWIEKPHNPKQFPFMGERALHNGPGVVLERTFGPGDRWCTEIRHREKPDDAELSHNPFYTFQAQLALELGFLVRPTRIVIEYFPDAAGIDILAAPSEIELWAEFENEATRDHAWAIALDCDLHEISEKRPQPDNAPPKWTRNQYRINSILHQLGFSTKHIDPADMAMPDTFVRMGQFEFKAFEKNWIQGFDLDAVFGKLGKPTRRLVLRVRSSHGRVYTCFYRVRLEGLSWGFNSWDTKLKGD